MTALVAIRCADGVVIGADGFATFGNHQLHTIEQPTAKKIQIVGDRVIVAGTGYVGHGQRFYAVVNQLWKDGAFMDKSGIAIAKALSKAGVNDFGMTMPPAHLKAIDLTAFVAYPAEETPFLCELPGAVGFQPEIKDPADLWFATAGSHQAITDSFLALFRSVFWADGPPRLEGGIFTALWALLHACDVNPDSPFGSRRRARTSRESWRKHGFAVSPVAYLTIRPPARSYAPDAVGRIGAGSQPTADPSGESGVNPGGVKEPIKIATLSRVKGKFLARELGDGELREHRDMVEHATKHFAEFRDILLGRTAASAVPRPGRP